MYQIKRSNAVSHMLQTKWLIVNQLGDAISFCTNYDEDFAPTKEEKKQTLMDSIKGFFSNPEEEDVAMLEEDTMIKLVQEMESIGADRETTMNSETAIIGEEFTAEITETSTVVSSPVASEEHTSVMANDSTVSVVPAMKTEQSGSYDQVIVKSIEKKEVAKAESPVIVTDAPAPVQPKVTADLNTPQIPKKTVDYASYFRSTGGFSAGT